jgi:hypothetical protein
VPNVATIDAQAAQVRQRMGEAATEVEPVGDDRVRITADDGLPSLAFRLI